MAGRLEGKVAIVTGAGSSGPGYGVGKAISILFAREGVKVALVDKLEERARETLEEIKTAGGEAFVITADIIDPAEDQRIIDETVERYGRLDTLINNAAVAPPATLLDTTPELYHSVMNVNLTATFQLSRVAIPAMIDAGGGSITCITSLAAYRGSGVSLAAYATSKAGMLGLTTDIATSYGRQGIRINTVMPGHVATPIRNQTAKDWGVDPSTIDMSDRTALGFEGDAWDIARAALFFSSDDARYVTGQHLAVDGGTSLRAP